MIHENDFKALHAIEAEQSVLGGLLVSSEAVERVSDLLPGDFFTEAHRIIYSRIILMAANRKPIDVVTVADELKNVGELDRVGGLGYLAELAGGVFGASNIGRYASMVIEKRMLRDLLAASGDIHDLATGANGMPARDRIDAAQARLFALSSDGAASSDPVSVSELLGQFVANLQHRVDSGGEITGVASGFTDLDKITNGFQPGDLIIIAGRPSMGKTTLAMNIAERVAISGGVSLVFSLEMSKDQVVERSVCSLGGIDNKKMRAGKLDEEEWDRVTTSVSRLDRVKLLIDDGSSISVAQMMGRARRIKRKAGRLDLVVIDYLQLMGASSAEKQNRNEELSAITRGLKLMARDLGVPVIALSQLSRKVEERTDKRPMMSDLRESGAIEQDADLILMAYRDDYYNPDSPFKGLAEIIIRKHRMGEIGDVKLVFQGQYCRFVGADQASIAKAIQASAEAREAAKPTTRKRGFVYD